MLHETTPHLFSVSNVDICCLAVHNWSGLPEFMISVIICVNCMNSASGILDLTLNNIKSVGMRPSHFFEFFFMLLLTFYNKTKVDHGQETPSCVRPRSGVWSISGGRTTMTNQTVKPLLHQGISFV